MDDYHLKQIPIGKLIEFANTALKDRATYPFLPISPERALSQANNPAASDDDIGLIVAYHREKCIGYRGFMPCWAKADNKVHKIYAPTTFYVQPEYRRQKIFEDQTVATYIHTVFFKLGFDGLVTGSSRFSSRFYSRDSRFVPTPPLKYVRIRTGLFFPFSSVIKKIARINILRIVRPLLMWLSAVCSITIDWLVYQSVKMFLLPTLSDDIECVKVENISELTTDENISQPNTKMRGLRNEKIINWMMRFPWVMDDNQIKSDYYFATPRERFEFLPYHLMKKENNKLIGYAVFSLSTENGYTTLKMLDYKIINDNYRPYILKLAFKIAAKENANVIEGSNDYWKYIKSSTLLRKVTGQHERSYYLWGKKGGVFEQHNFDFHLDYNDCDKPFT